MGSLTLWEIENNDIEECFNNIYESTKPDSDVTPYFSSELNEIKKLKSYRFSQEGNYMLTFGHQNLVVVSLTDPEEV